MPGLPFPAPSLPQDGCGCSIPITTGSLCPNSVASYSPVPTPSDTTCAVNGLPPIVPRASDGPPPTPSACPSLLPE